MLSFKVFSISKESISVLHRR